MTEGRKKAEVMPAEKIETSEVMRGRKHRMIKQTNKPKRKAERYPPKRARLSKEEHREDALALRAEERRDKLRKAAGRSKYPEIRGYLNGETHLRKPQVPLNESIV